MAAAWGGHAPWLCRPCLFAAFATFALPYTRPMPDAAAALKSNWLTTLGWAAYLACSWTWCIGMFLPVLLIRDYGIMGFVVFAIPNVIGAAAMGWVLRSERQSVTLATAHESMSRCFSLITVLFHGFFIAWMYRSLYQTDAPHVFDLVTVSLCLMGPMLLVLVFSFARVWRDRPIGAASMSLLISVVVGYILLSGVDRPHGGIVESWSRAELPWMRADVRLALLAPVCLFGFVLCPYLDLTFHRARSQLRTHQSRVAFSLGFGVLFLSMILLTLAYGTKLIIDAPALVYRGDDGLPELLLLHFVVQSAFTCIVHWRELARSTALTSGWSLLGIVLTVGTGLAAGALLGNVDVGVLWPGELLYRLFMSAYGLFFPAYVWLCMIPTWHDPRPPTRRMLTIWAAACALATPAFWMGFIERQEIWLAPGLAVVLLARLLIPGAITRRASRRSDEKMSEQQLLSESHHSPHP